MKKIIFLLAAVFMTIGLATPSAAATDISVYLDGKKLSFDVPPQIINNRAMVPFRVISESLGAKCHWIAEDKTVVLEKGNQMIGLIIGHSKIYFSDGNIITNTYDLDVAPQIVKNRTLVPLRAVSQAFDSEVNWDDKTKTVDIKTSEYKQSLSKDTGSGSKIITTAEEYKNAAINNLNEFNKTFTIKTQGLDTQIIAQDLTEWDDRIFEHEFEIMKNGEYAETTYKIVYKAADIVYSAYKMKNIMKLNDKEIEIYNKAKSIVESIITPNMIDYEKELKIHDYIILNSQYDVEAQNSDNRSKDVFTPYGTLINGVSVCYGYAESFRLLAKMSGLECETIFGDTDVFHAWNRVKIDGDYYLVDVTYDDPTPDIKNNVVYAYFNLTDEQMRDHVPEKIDDIKCTATKYNYFNYNKLNFSSQEEFEKLVESEIAKGNKNISLKAVNCNLDELNLSAVYKYNGNLGFRKFTNPKQNTILIILE